MTKKEILLAADKATDRTTERGVREDSFFLISELWNAYLRYEPALDEHDVAIMMALLKIVRIHEKMGGMDSYIDAIGYLALAGEMADE